MNCPEKEQLMLYVEGELNSTEVAEIKAHLASCSNCQHEVELLKSELASESLIRDKVNIAFKKRSVASNIMKAVMAEPKPVKTTKTSSFWSGWLVKLMVPALALAIALFVLLSGSPSQMPQKYNEKAYRVSVFANNDEVPCYVDGEAYVANKSFNIDAESLKKLDGNFLVNVVTANEIYSLKVEGKTSLGFDVTSMTPVFEDCKAKISMNNGRLANVRVNGSKYEVNLSNPYELKIEEKEKIDSKVESKQSKIEEPVKEEKVEVATITENIQEKEEASLAAEDNHPVTDNEAVEAAEIGEEILTQNENDDITINSSDSLDVETSGNSPFSE